MSEAMKEAINSSHPEADRGTTRYNEITEYARNFLVVIFNVILGVVNVLVYPLYKQPNLMITFTLGIALVFTYVILWKIDLSTLNALVMHVLVLINITLASIMVDIPFYFSVGFILYLVLTLFLVRVKYIESPENQDTVILISLISLCVCTLVFWYENFVENFIVSQTIMASSYWEWEIIAIQLFLAAVTFFFGWTAARKNFFYIPLLLNTLLVPVVLSGNINIAAAISDGFININSDTLTRFVLNWVVFGLLTVIAFIFTWKINNEVQSRITTVIAAFLSVIQLTVFSFLRFDGLQADPILTNSFVLVIAILFIINWFKFKGQGLIDEISSVSIASLVISTSVLSRISGLNYVNFLALLVVLTLLCIIPMVVINTKIERLIPVLAMQTFGFYFLSMNMVTQFTVLESLTFDLLSLAIGVFVIYLLFLGYFYRTDSNSLTIISFCSTLLAVAFIFTSSVLPLTSFVLPTPEPLVIALLLAIPSFLLFFSTNERFQLNVLISQGFGIAVFALLSKQQIIIPGSEPLYINLVSLLLVLYVGMGLLSWYRNRNQFTPSIFVNINLLACSLVSLFAIESRMPKLFHIPDYIVLGTVVLILSLFQLKLTDVNEKKKVLIFQALALFFLSFYDITSELNLSLLNSIANEIIDLTKDWLTAPFMTLLYLVFVLLTYISWHRIDQVVDSRSAPSFEQLSFETVLEIISHNSHTTPVLVLLSLSTVLSITSPIMSHFLAVGVLSVLFFMLAIKAFQEQYLISYGVAALNIFVLMLDSNQLTIYFDEEPALWLTSLVYLGFSILILEKWRREPKAMFNPVIIILSVLTFVLTIFPTPVRIPLEFLGLTISFFSLLALKSKNDIEIQGITFIQAALLFIISVWQRRHVLIAIILKPLVGGIDLIGGSLVIITLLYLIYAIILNAKILPSIKDIYITRNVVGSFLVLTAILNLFTPDPVHPLALILVSALILAILGLSYPATVLADLRVRELMPIAQVLGFSSLLIRPITFDLFDLFELSLFPLVLGIWVLTMLIAWYWRGTINQLATILTSTFIFISTHSGANLFGFATDIEDQLSLIINGGIIIILMICIVILLYLFYRKISQCDHFHQVIIYLSSTFAMIAVSLDIGASFTNEELLLLRLLIELFVFVPVVVQARFILGRYISHLSVINDSGYKLESITIGYTCVFTLPAIIMGTEGFFSLKILVIAIMLWTFPITFVRKSFAWLSSIFTILSAIFVFSQTTIIATPKEIIGFFLVLSFIGLLFVAISYLNEIKGKGEPVTGSLAITGSFLTVISIFGLKNTEERIGFLTPDILNFLPNITWAILGCILVFFAFAYKKPYMRRFGLGVLLLDIVLSAIDFLSTDNEFIQIFGNMFLGAVLILIYYLYSKEIKEAGVA
ncbi:MAG: hypothetical protein ACXADY_18815 [Candidatus Hodarchaeales archaeon]